MDWTHTPTLWWLLAGALVAAELLSGTFYLLMLALAAGASAVAAHAGLSVVQQLVLGAVVGSALVLQLYWRRSRLAAQAPSAQANPDVQQDIGALVQVSHWHADGTAHVLYRGAQWTVQHHGSDAAQSGQHRVVQVVGNRLLVEKV